MNYNQPPKEVHFSTKELNKILVSDFFVIFILGFGSCLGLGALSTLLLYHNDEINSINALIKLILFILCILFLLYLTSGSIAQFKATLLLKKNKPTLLYIDHEKIIFNFPNFNLNHNLACKSESLSIDHHLGIFGTIYLNDIYSIEPHTDIIRRGKSTSYYSKIIIRLKNDGIIILPDALSISIDELKKLIPK